MDLKSPLTIDEQVARLIQHGLVIKNNKKAAEILSEINYYRFTGYALQYRVSPHQSDYINNVTNVLMVHDYIMQISIHQPY